ncbi:sorbitol dehydrogenase [Oceanobacillus oncorhynchi subsp. incaldanensis]|uniref:zinc-dependent alcohol dehydrogenase n=1 Tax=Oceanobacillus oncorhynchi TaxID=545501 RepID=UPI001B1C60B8|nr:alcohol dehydrogenase catalytic domain-containing protein [Oceanobacillus oncorhynchi]GIO20351.1 sorbitol dehydrogenase [Oceanobacillus oncorhynchi subsp. incaldanensis]
MQAIVKNELGDSNIYLKNVDTPALNNNEVLIKVKYAGICGTDLHIMKDEYPHNPPVIMGHEFSGIVEKAGSECSMFKRGDRVVSITATDTCGLCQYCRKGQLMFCKHRKSIGSHVDGAFAEYIKLPEDNLYLIPQKVTMKEAALTEPLACGVRCIIERGTINPSDRVLISGCGPIALIALQVAKTSGAECVLIGTSKDIDKFELANKLGAIEVFNIEDASSKNALYEKEDFDACIECAGASASLSTCLDLVKKQGNIIQMGIYGQKIDVDLDLLLLKEINYTNGFATEPTSFEIALKLLKQKAVNVGPLVTHCFDIEDYEQAFEKAYKGGIKVLIEP